MTNDLPLLYKFAGVDSSVLLLKSADKLFLRADEQTKFKTCDIMQDFVRRGLKRRFLAGNRAQQICDCNCKDLERQKTWFPTSYQSHSTTWSTFNYYALPYSPIAKVSYISWRNIFFTGFVASGVWTNESHNWRSRALQLKIQTCGAITTTIAQPKFAT